MAVSKVSGETKALMGTIAAAVVTIIGAVAFLDMKESARMERIEAHLVRMEERIAADIAELKAGMVELKGIMTGRGQTPARPSGK